MRSYIGLLSQCLFTFPILRATMLGRTAEISQERTARPNPTSTPYMTNSSANPRLPEAAQNGCVPYALLKDIAVQATRTAPDLLDELSCFVALQYFADEMDFEEADSVINALWAVCVSNEFWADHDQTIPPVTNAVYLAFDAGEYYRESDAPGTDPEVKYTRPLIEAFLAEHNKTGSRL